MCWWCVLKKNRHDLVWQSGEFMQHSSAKPASKLGLTELIAIGVGGMIGGGIFSVLGLAVSISGHAAPIAFAIGAVIAFAAGYSFAKLSLAFPGNGSNFTYLCHAFPSSPWIASLSGWAIIIGYVGTLALYAFTFGAYGAHLLGDGVSVTERTVLSAAVLMFFMVINLKGIHDTGIAEDLVVYGKIIILALFGLVGLWSVKGEHLFPVFDRGVSGVFMAGALIFVAYEGFQLVTNAMDDSHDPERNIPRGIYTSILITSAIYVSLALVAVGNLTASEITVAKEYALATVAEPVMGNVGIVLVDIAALLATSSAINGTVFGASRLMAVIADKGMMPGALSLRSASGVPWAGVLTLTASGLLFTVLGGLEAIAAFSSMTFLLVSLSVSVANLKLRDRTYCAPWVVLGGIVMMLATIALLCAYLWLHSRTTLYLILGLYFLVFAAERIFNLGIQKRGQMSCRG